MRFADDGDPTLRVEMRHIVLHLLRPDEFERIFSGGHKQQVVRRLQRRGRASRRSASGEASIIGCSRFVRPSRGSRQSDGDEPVNFYMSPYKEQWQSPVGSIESDDLTGAKNGGPEGPRWFWVNQGQTWKAERDEGILWAPLLSKNGLKLHHWERMDELRPGDVVIHYSGAIRAVSRATDRRAAAEARLAEQRRMGTGRPTRSREYVELQQAISLNEIPSFLADRRAAVRSRAAAVCSRATSAAEPELRTDSSPLRRATRRDRSAGSLSPGLASSLTDTFGPSEGCRGVRVAVAGDRVQALMAALVAKPFVILAGLSGSGKTQLGLRFGEWLGAGTTVRLS